MSGSKIFRPRPDISPDKLNFSGCRLIIPAISCGNVGQLAVDLLVCSLVKRKALSNVAIVGSIISRYVEPLSCRRDYGIKTFGQLCSAVDVYRSGQNVLVHQRSIITSGCSGAFVSELRQWIIECGFDRVVVLGGASATGRGDRQICDPMQVRYIHKGKQQNCSELVKLKEVGIPVLNEISEPLILAGLLKSIVRVLAPKPDSDLCRADSTTDSLATRVSKAPICTDASFNHQDEVVPDLDVLALVLFCMEGVNFVHGAQMALYADAILHILPSSTSATNVNATKAETNEVCQSGGTKEHEIDTFEATRPSFLKGTSSSLRLPPGWSVPPSWTMPAARPDPALF